MWCGPRPVAVTCAVAAGVVGTLAGDYSSGTAHGLIMLDFLVGVLTCALAPLIVRRPVPGALALVALAAVAGSATPAVSAGVVNVAWRRRFPLAVVIGVAAVAAHAIRGLWWPVTGLPYGWWLVLVVFGNAALVGWGALAQAHAALVGSLRERAERAEAEQGRRVAEARAAERARIAREMHDVLAHRLSLLATYAGALEFRPDVPPERLSMAAGVIRSTVHQALDELRDVISVLRDDNDGTDGPAPPVPALADLPVLVEESRAVGTPVEVRDGLPDASALPGMTGRTAYRVVQEALTNARKHAPGQPVSIALDGRPGTRLVIDVRNALGTGSAIPGAGAGLVGLTERVRLAGGELDHHATTEEFRLHAWLPWPA